MALAVLTPVVAAACAGEDQMGSPSHRMLEWVSGTGFGEQIGTLVADNQRVPKDVPNGTGAVHAACGTLENDAEMANGELPAPDPQVTAWLSEAYGLEGSAGAECYNAGATDKKLLAQAYRDSARAEALFHQVLARIHSVDGRAVSTTTTTNNTPGGVFG
ncbi:MAG TPA: hypothetical protein VNG12_04875 [Acidimicrobiales bacterium]|nr:hypothetical protein [Acidimicrobiales bacterium]